MDFITYCEGKRGVVKDKNVSWSSEFGKVDREDLLKAKHGSVVKTSKGKDVLLLKPTFKDKYLNMKRGAQSIKLKDCGAILAETLVGKDSVCLDCGSGMGGLTCFLASYVEKVYSVDNREDHLKLSRKNAQSLGLKNIDFIQHDIYEGMPKDAKKLDLITLDVAHPEQVVPHAKAALKKGGFLVGYCPQATQMHDLCDALEKHKLQVYSCREVIVRSWKCEGKVLRPEHMGLMHTAFLVFAQRID